MNRKKKIWFVTYVFLLFVWPVSHSQNYSLLTMIRGAVVDAGTNEPVPFAGVTWLDKNNNGTLTDDKGNFTLKTKDTTSRIIVTCLGYLKKIVPVKVGKTQKINITMYPDVKTLNDVVVKPKKTKYRNKGNPAVELINRVIEHKSGNREEDIDFYAYEKYEKSVFYLANYSEKFAKSIFIRNFKFVFDNIDTTIIPGRKSAPIFLKENISDVYYQKNPEKKLEVPVAEKMVSFEDYVNNKSVNAFIKILYLDIDIYNNNILLLTNQFISPISSVAPTFYKYFIIDTTIIDNTKCIKLAFFPRNRNDFLFQGNLFIALDSSYAVKKIDMSLNKDINLNWIKNMEIVQEFNKIQNRGWILTTNEIAIEFGLTSEKMGIMGQRVVTYNNYQLDKTKSDSIYAAISKNRDKETKNNDEAFWEAHRMQKLTKPEQRVYVLLDSLKNSPTFKLAMDVTLIISSGYFGSRNAIEIGPIGTFYGFNPIEGIRYKFGGRTTPHFNKKIYFGAYGAYGTTDEKYKYYIASTYLFSNGTIFGFPIKSVSISYRNDIQIPGEDMMLAQQNSFFLSFMRGINYMMYYNKTFRIEHLNEFSNYFSYSAAFEYNRQTPTGELYYNTTNYSPVNNVKYINIPQIVIGLRYAPHEQFFQGKVYRIAITNKYPIFLFQYSLGNKLIGNNFNYQKLMLDVSKRFYWSFLGYTDATFETGKIFGQVSFPLLEISRANQTYTYQSLSYNMMNFLEFVNDKYVALFADHCFNGFILNKVPIIKMLKLREYVTCKVLYGGISKNNNPDLEPGLFKFPIDKNGAPITYTFGNVPYIETSVGISNILKFFRIDYVQRLTYLNHPNVSKNGIRFDIKMDF